tara:strand:+ start:47 stop:490 length:444 start_codon:yes stop_codon:yes gene_type:complete
MDGYYKCGTPLDDKFLSVKYVAKKLKLSKERILDVYQEESEDIGPIRYKNDEEYLSLFQIYILMGFLKAEEICLDFCKELSKIMDKYNKPKSTSVFDNMVISLRERDIKLAYNQLRDALIKLRDAKGDEYKKGLQEAIDFIEDITQE